jgi:hypothetical protein
MKDVPLEATPKPYLFTFPIIGNNMANERTYEAEEKLDQLTLGSLNDD